ncbi:MAG: NHL repeat-containing protein [Acidobacteriota bacterium]
MIERRALIMVTLVFLSALANGAPALQGPAWTIPVPEGTRVIEYAPTVAAASSASIDFTEDLAIGPGSSEPEYLFYRASDVAIDVEENIYVLDAGNHRVQVFDADGQFLRSFGREGQGPGEFRQPQAMALRGDRVWIVDNLNHRVSEWTLGGELAEDRSAEPRGLSIERFAALANGSFLLAFDTDQVPQARVGVVRLSAAGAVMHRYVDRGRRSTIMRRADVEDPSVPAGYVLPAPAPGLAAGNDGRAYLTNGDEYQVLALDGTGAARWALRVGIAKRPFPESYVESMFQGSRERGGKATAAQFDDWRPRHFPMIQRLEVDGRGRLWVFLYAQFTPAPPDRLPVDIYSPEGERLLSASAPAVPWSAAYDDFVYSIEVDRDTAEQKVVRYRIDLPHDR